MMPIDFGNLFSSKLFSLESCHDTILCNKHLVYYESVTNTYFSFLFKHALNFSNIPIIYMNGAVHFPIICQSGKKSMNSKTYGNYTGYDSRFIVRVR